MPFRNTVSEAPDLPAGRYYGRIVELEERYSELYEKDFIIWHCEVFSAGELVKVTGTSSTAWSPKSVAFGWASAVMGQRLDPRAAAPAYETFAGRRVVVRVGPNKRDWPSVLELEPFTGSTDGLMGFPAVAAAAEPVPRPTPVTQPAPVAQAVNGTPSVAGWPMHGEAPAAVPEPAPTLAEDGLPF